ncbi:hypothetical protein LCGC14_2457220 [marine sediment metagenome]|uniref:Uncharacterized protein n=1 Tax=marine sediment metagenome TaxID=412755 RepID=A0A0F9C211_9ZZZZ
MTVKELIEELKKVDDQNLPVRVSHDDTDGCDTCGYGCSVITEDVSSVNDLETRVELGLC